MRALDAVHRDGQDKRRFEREFESAALHDLTYSLNDWKASAKHAFPLERVQYQDAPDAPSPQLPPVQDGTGVRFGMAATLSRPASRAAAGPVVPGLSLPLRGTAGRASKMLASITPHQWAELTKDGAPEAWQMTRKGTKTFNTNMRKELAHISRLRDLHRQGRAQSTPPNAGFFESRLGGAGPAGGAGGILQMQDTPPSRQGYSPASRQQTPASVRPATSMSALAPPPGSSAGRELTPNTLKQRHTLELLGTESRPSSVYRVLKKRQPQAQMHMLWTGGPKRFDAYKQNVEAELLAEKKAANMQRKLLIKQMRHKMQVACANTKTLPTDLWQKFKVADEDGSGRVEVSIAAPSCLILDTRS